MLALDRGYYYAYPGCINLPPDMDQAFWLSVNEVDNNNKIIEAIPAGAGYKYFYKAKKINGTWQGWNKYPEYSDLNNLSTIQSGQCTAWNGTKFEVNYAYRIGRIAIVSVQGTNEQLSNVNNFALFTVPWTPNHNLGISGIVRNNSTGLYLPSPMALKTTSIAVENENTNAGYTWFRVCFVYFTT